MAEVKKSQGQLDRERELARRKAREEEAKRQQSVIVHSPAQK